MTDTRNVTPMDPKFLASCPNCGNKLFPEYKGTDPYCTCGVRIDFDAKQPTRPSFLSKK